jgi:hypothetical protein
MKTTFVLRTTNRFKLAELAGRTTMDLKALADGAALSLNPFVTTRR